MLVLVQLTQTAFDFGEHLSIDAFGEVQYCIAFLVCYAFALSATSTAFGKICNPFQFYIVDQRSVMLQ
jgi:hypothetical protein